MHLLRVQYLPRSSETAALIIVPITQEGKLRLGDMKELAQHRARGQARTRAQTSALGEVLVLETRPELAEE